MLLDHVKTMPLPRSPLDDLIDQLGGPEEVAEMTGRRSRVVRYCVSKKDKRESIRYESRETVSGISVSSGSSGVDSLNIREVSESPLAPTTQVHFCLVYCMCYVIT